MIQNYGLLSESLSYRQFDSPLFEALAIDEWIKKVDPKELETAIRFFADSSDPAKKDGGITTVAGKKVKVEFQQNPSEAGTYKAVFTFVDNPNMASDFADILNAAMSGLGTDEDGLYASAAAYRKYCQDTGKDEYSEMYKVQEAFQAKYKKDLASQLSDELVPDTFTLEEFNLFVKGLFLIGKRADVGEQRASRIVDYTKPDFAVRMLNVDQNHNNSIEFILGCPLKNLRAINDALKAKTQKGLMDTVKESEFGSDVKDIVKYYLMGAGLIKTDAKFQYATKIASEGKPQRPSTSYQNADQRSTGGF